MTYTEKRAELDTILAAAVERYRAALAISSRQHRKYGRSYDNGRVLRLAGHIHDLKLELEAIDYEQSQKLAACDS